MKEIKFKLQKKAMTETADDENGGKEKYTYVPVDETFNKKVKIEISQESGSGIVEDMGLPTETGDHVFIEIGKTNKQTKLTDENKVQEKPVHEPLPVDEYGPVKKRKPRRRKNGDGDRGTKK